MRPSSPLILSFILTEAQPFIIVFLYKGREWIKEGIKGGGGFE